MCDFLQKKLGYSSKMIIENLWYTLVYKNFKAILISNLGSSVVQKYYRKLCKLDKYHTL